jgi:hypothetical protein
VRELNDQFGSLLSPSNCGANRLTYLFSEVSKRLEEFGRAFSEPV